MDSLKTRSVQGQTVVRHPAFCNLPIAARKRNSGHSPTVAELRKSVFSVPVMGISRSCSASAFSAMISSGMFRNSGCLPAPESHSSR
uniref:Uncharacterized protein n=1 Tax=Escherichia coli TaxID=562 RepID=A0A6M4P786_ECOLX|nr:hypothetical protein G6850_00037 [Escherichia coli]